MTEITILILLACEPEEIIARGAYAKEVDVMIGFNEHEGILGTQVMLLQSQGWSRCSRPWDIIGQRPVPEAPSEITAEDINLSKFILYEIVGLWKNLA